MAYMVYEINNLLNNISLYILISRWCKWTLVEQWNTSLQMIALLLITNGIVLISGD